MKDITQVYVARVDCLCDGRTFACLLSKVSPERREKILRMKNEKEKRLSLGAGSLLLRALRDSGVASPEIEYTKMGKPALRGRSDICFNLSHSESTVMCAVSPMPVGCDTEFVRPRSLQVAKRFFTPQELSLIEREETEEKRLSMFYRLWTLKESFVKATGQGMSIPFDSFNVEIGDGEIRLSQVFDAKHYYFKEYELSDGYKYSVCSLCKEFSDILFVSLEEI